jgi:hypothetical protein
MGLEVDFGAVSEIEGDASGGDGDSDDGEDGVMVPDDRKLYLSGRAACGGDSDADGGEDGRMGLDLHAGYACSGGGDNDSGEDGGMGLEADSGAVSEVDGDAGAPAAAIGIMGVSEVEESTGDRSATKATHALTPRGLRDSA